MAKQLQLGLDLKGGVHLVLRVQTDDALQDSHDDDERADPRSAADRGGHRRLDRRRLADDFPGRRRAGGSRRRVPPHRRRAGRRRTTTAAPAPAAPTTFTMKPNIESDMREQTVVQALETIDRRVNELGVAEPNISRYGQLGDQILVQLPGVTDVGAREGDHPADRAARAEDRRSRARRRRRKRCCRRTAGRCRRTWKSCPAPAAPGDTGTRVLPGAQGGGGRPARDLRGAKPTIDENNRPAVSFSLNSRRGAQVRQGHWREHRPLAGDRPRQPRAVGAAHRRPDHRRRAHHRQLHQRGSRRSLADAAVRRAAGVADLPRRARRSARRSAPTRSGPACSPRSSASCWSSSFMLVYYKLSGINAVVALVMQPGHPARPDGLLRRGHDAAGHRRLRPDDGHRRRLERADLRAHQGGARGAARRRARRSTPASRASS